MAGTFLCAAPQSPAHLISGKGEHYLWSRHSAFTSKGLELDHEFVNNNNNNNHKAMVNIKSCHLRVTAPETVMQTLVYQGYSFRDMC